MSKTDGRREFGVSRTAVTQAKGHWGCLPGFRGMLAGVLAGCVVWGAGAREAQGQGVAPVNPAFLKWQQEEKAAATAARARGVARSEEEDGEYGLIPSPMDLSYLATLNSGAVQGPVGGFPSSYDLRTSGRVTAVRNQGNYGTCWAHAALGSLESWILTSEGVTKDFSENNMANLHGGDWEFNDGGNADRAAAYLLRWSGPVEETLDPYPGPGKSVSKEPARHVQKVVWVPGKSAALDNDAIKEAVMTYGALYVIYYHGSSYYNTGTAAYYYPGGGYANHAVAIVGWNDNYPASNFSQKPSGNGAYLVRNSWGAYWGKDGYFWASYYDSVFARDTMYAFCNAESSNNYGKIYQHDPLGMCASLGVTHGANMFTAMESGTLAAVGFYAMVPKTGYELSVYTGCSSGNPVSGTKAATQSGTISAAGFSSIPLNKTVSVAKGSRFSVVLKLTTPGFGYPHAIEYAIGGYSSKASAGSGQSFYSTDGASWKDLTSWNSTANFCIKAYTKGASAEVPKLAGVEIRGPRSVESGKTGQYACDATYSDGSRKEGVAASWSLASGGDWATIGGTGLLKAKTVTANCSATIRASFTADGVTKTADFAVTIAAGAPAVPTNVAATTNNTRSVTVTWSASEGAAEYAVYRGDVNDSGKAEFKYNATATKYSDTTAVPGEEYWYFVKAKNGSGTDVKSSGFSAGAKGIRLLQAPSDVTATTELTDRIEVAWGAVEGGVCYRVARSTAPGGHKTWLGNWQEARRFTDRTCGADTAYYYYVSVAKDASGRMAAEGEVYAEGRMPAPVVPVSLEVRGPESLASGVVGRYEAHVVYSDKRVDDAAVSATWTTTAGNVRTEGTTCVVTAPVQAANGEMVVTATWEGLTGTKKVTVKAVTPGQVTGLKVTSATASGVGLAWNAVAGASGYVMSRTGGSSGTATFKSAGTTYTDTTAGAGVEYTYTVSAENAAGAGPASVAVSALIPLAEPTGVTATTQRTDGVRVAWVGASGASHYHVGRATSQGGSKTELGTWTIARTFDDATAADNVEYWYFVKAATGADGSHASGWSVGAKGMKKPARVLTGLNISGPDKVTAEESIVMVCTATWSDGQKESVMPQWSATMGSIGADGKFTAFAVKEDATAEIRAAYGGMIANRTVLVVAPVPASASITSVTAAQRWPFAGLVDIDYTLETAPGGTKALVTVSAWDADHEWALAASSLEGEGAGRRPQVAGHHRMTWNLAADHPGFHAAELRVDVSAVVLTMDIPENVSATGTTAGIMLSWRPVDDAISYEVWRNVANDSGGAELLAGTTDTSFTDTTTEPGSPYHYWVRAVSEKDKSEFSDVAVGVRTLSAPTGMKAEGTTEKIVLSWASVMGAASYEVWRCREDDVASALSIGITTNTTFSDASTEMGVPYYYWTQAVCSHSTGGFSASVCGSRKISAPRGVHVTVGSDLASITVAWNSIAEANRYEVWRSVYTQASGGVETLVESSSKIATVDSGTLEYTETPDMSGNRFHRYQIRTIGTASTSDFSDYAEVRTYHNAGSYALEIPKKAQYWITAIGGGGGGGHYSNPNTGSIAAGGHGGGSGAAFQGCLSLAEGAYTLSVGAGGNHLNIFYSPQKADDGGASSLVLGGTSILRAGGGGGGRDGRADGGTVSVDSEVVVSTTVNAPGNAGGYRYVGSSVLGGYGAGGYSAQSGGTGFFQIAINPDGSGAQ